MLDAAAEEPALHLAAGGADHGPPSLMVETQRQVDGAALDAAAVEPRQDMQDDGAVGAG